MPIDKRYIFNKTMFYLKKESKFFTSSDVSMIIGVDAFRRIAENIDYPKSNFSTFIASGVWTVTMPSDFLKVDQNKDVVFQNATNTYKVEPKYQKDIGRHIILQPPGSQIPQNYFMEDHTTVGLYPPSTSGIIVVPYVSIPTSLSTDTDTNQLTETCYMAAVYWTVSECMLKDDDAKDDSKFTKFYTLYEKETLRLRKRFGEMYEINYDLSPHEDYLQ
jgi:hypothetical protein